MSDPTADLAIRNLERLLGRDPLLRDIVHPVLPNAKRQARFSPDTDIVETDEAWILILEVPGVPRESLRVEIEGARLVVSGAKPARPSGRSKVAERTTGPFKRSFLVPFQVDQTTIRARVSDGLLTITLPRIAEGDKRAVPVEG